ncbi:hypothetical protein J27TS7_49950 [Paenibacillus dendritiformis]|nr:hypothetical protein J27TS7_49950 [Paenibacillus dendritiformis]
MMHFGGLDAAGSNAFVLWGVAVGFLVLLLASRFKAPGERLMRPQLLLQAIKIK